MKRMIVVLMATMFAMLVSGEVGAEEAGFGPVVSVQMFSAHRQPVNRLTYGLGAVYGTEKWLLSVTESRGSQESLGNAFDQNRLFRYGYSLYLGSFAVDKKTAKSYTVMELLARRYVTVQARGQEKPSESVRIGLGLGIAQVQTLTTETVRYDPGPESGYDILNPKFQNSEKETLRQIPIGLFGMKIEEKLPSGISAALVMDWKVRLGKNDTDVYLGGFTSSLVLRKAFR